RRSSSYVSGWLDAALADCHLEVARLAGAHDAEGLGGPNFQLPERVEELIQMRRRLVGQGHDDVALEHAAFARPTVRLDAEDQQAALLVDLGLGRIGQPDRLGADAQVAALDPAARLQAVPDSGRGLDRDGHADTAPI